mmetsp:Transcript_91135/g.256885  ORF Transcript_91135/g.256885 Transcript_91135/m.256885 type:complete len:277 (+) Transcript_91135:110-940(+)
MPAKKKKSGGGAAAGADDDVALEAAVDTAATEAAAALEAAEEPAVEEEDAEDATEEGQGATAGGKKKKKKKKKSAAVGEEDADEEAAPAAALAAAAPAAAVAEANGEDDEEDDDGEDGGGLSGKCSLVLMAVTTCFIAVCSEMLVGAIEEVVGQGKIPASFIGIIVLPFAGNACEHASAIRFALQDRPGLSIGIAVGSSTQIALFVVPFTVVMGWVMDQPMDLVFGAMNTAVMILSVLVVLTLVIDGRSNWLKGFMLCTAYVFCAVLYWYMPPPLE